MADRRQLEFFLLRYVPNVAREEFVNIGLVMRETGGDGGGFAEIHFTANWQRARWLDPYIDVEMLEALGRDMEKRLKDVNQQAMLLHEMMDSYSNALQLSPIRRCVAENPAQEFKDLARQLVEISWDAPPLNKTPRLGRQWIHRQMSEVFAAEELWDFLLKDIRASTYTIPEDDFVLDFAYPVGNEFKIFHAVSLASVGRETRMFPLRVAKIAEGMKKKVSPNFTAVVEDRFNEEEKAVKTVLAFMANEKIRVRRLAEMPMIAQEARQDLRL